MSLLKISDLHARIEGDGREILKNPLGEIVAKELEGKAERPRKENGQR